MKPHITTIKDDCKHWKIFIAIGILFILIGFYTILFPFEHRIGSENIFGALGVLTGAGKIYFIFRHKAQIAIRKWTMSVAFSEIIAGIFLLTYNGFTMVMLPFLLSFWILAGAITLIEEASGIQQFHASQYEWLLGAIGLTIISTFILAFLPLLGIVTTLFWAASCMIIMGVYYVLLSFRLKAITKIHHL